MKLLEHIKTEQGYIVRIWLDEIAPDAIEEYTWGPYKATLRTQSFDENGKPVLDEDGEPTIYEDIPWEITQKKYESDMVDQAMALATQTLAQLQPTETVVKQDKAALKAQQDAVDALKEPDV